MAETETMDEIIERFEREVAGGVGPITVKIGRGLYHEMRRARRHRGPPVPQPRLPRRSVGPAGYARARGVFTPPDSSAPDWDYVMGDGGLTPKG